jgi:pimeloyl-ACP methyl ester carboxylesterase
MLNLYFPLQDVAMNYSPVLRWFSTTLVLILSVGAVSASSPAVIVIGFVGGFVHHDDAVHREVQLADRLRKDYPNGTEIRVFENHLRTQAHQEILRLLDSDHNGTLSAQEKSEARIVLYGHSWGATEAVRMARTLQKDQVPVLLTIQVDSVSKLGADDRSIPANVAQAVNFYQLDGLLHGQRRIVADDPLHTQILGNFKFDYKTNSVDCDGYPWYAKIFMKPHIEIESDPNVWNQVESLIRSKLPSVERASQ